MTSYLSQSINGLSIDIINDNDDDDDRILNVRNILNKEDNLDPVLFNIYFSLLKTINTYLINAYENFRNNPNDLNLCKIILELYDRKYIIYKHIDNGNYTYAPFDVNQIKIKICVFLVDENDENDKYNERKKIVIKYLNCLYDIIFYNNEKIDNIEIDDIYELDDNGLTSLSSHEYSIFLSNQEIDNLIKV